MSLGELKWKKTRGAPGSSGAMMASNGACRGFIMRAGGKKPVTTWSVSRAGKWLDGGRGKSMKDVKARVRRAMRYCTGPKRAK